VKSFQINVSAAPAKGYGPGCSGISGFLHMYKAHWIEFPCWQVGVDFTREDGSKDDSWLKLVNEDGTWRVWGSAD